MNKDLEKEYKELMSANVPDLWDKIEVGLDSEQPNVKKINRLKKLSVWGAAAAAAVFCLVISVPVMFGGRKGSSSDGGMTGGNMSPPQNNENTADYAEVWEKDISAPTADDMPDTEGTPGEDAHASDIITAKVTEIWEENGETMLTVLIEDIYSGEAGYMNFSEGDTIALHDMNSVYKNSYKDLKKGEIYYFEIMIQIDDSGAAEYFIEDIW